MASNVTKQKILDNAVGCFNRDGIANVRLQHIAEDANKSIGNMPYPLFMNMKKNSHAQGGPDRVVGPDCRQTTEVHNYRFVCAACGKPCANVVQGNELLIERVEMRE
jgi:hypothetical protein